jgi:hypothetical protein
VAGELGWAAESLVSTLVSSAVISVLMHSLMEGVEHVACRA